MYATITLFLLFFVSSNYRGFLIGIGRTETGRRRVVGPDFLYHLCRSPVLSSIKLVQCRAVTTVRETEGNDVNSCEPCRF